MVIIRIIIYFTFSKRLRKLFAIMDFKEGRFNPSQKSLEGNDELAKIAKAFQSSTDQTSGILNDMVLLSALKYH
jgi:hypothetical protein